MQHMQIINKREFSQYKLPNIETPLPRSSLCISDKYNNNNNNDRLTAFDPGQPG